ncbi:oxidoreductase protein [Spatholobus suberectus]|nr:oxidoreductase protein [Spatholobus suberectus]
MKSLNLWPNPNPRILPCRSTSPTLNLVYSIPPSPSSVRCHSSLTQRPLRCAVLGAGFAGLSVVWHLLKQSPKELNLRIDIYDEVGIGGGASGISGGLLHPYSPKVKLLWEGAQCWKESMKLLRVAEEASVSMDCRTGESAEDMKAFVAQKRGILRPATDMKNMIKLNDNVKTCLPSCRVETLTNEEAQSLLPGVCLPFNTAFYMPEALNIHSQHYLKALLRGIENLVKESSTLDSGQKQLSLHKRSVHRLSEFEGEYDAVIVCLGAKLNMLPELSGRLPLRTCRGVIAHLELPDDMKGYPESAPSILSDAWIAVQGPRSLNVGSTWEWKSINSSPYVSSDEASKALAQLLPKACTIYPGIKDWVFTGARAGLRAMPPLTPLGSLPLLGFINDVIGRNHTCKYWLFGGLGSRGLLYHAWLGNLMAQAVLSCNEKVIPSELTSWKATEPNM